MRAESGLRVVIDTNVWISALLMKSGAPAVITHHIVTHGLPVFSPSTFAELESRLWLPKFDRYVSMEDRKLFLHDIDGLACWIDVPETLARQTFCRDVDDDKFIHAALAAGAPWLITGDRDLLAVPAQPNLQILTPTDALKQITTRS